MTVEKKLEIYRACAPKFETEEFKLYMEDMIPLIPDYIFEIPASTTMKYHNKTQCQKHGQIFHIAMQVMICDYRLSLKWYQDKWTPEVRDAIRCVPWLHDCLKCGEKGSAFSVFDHPLQARDFVLNTIVEHDISDEYKQMIANMCASHSGQWTTSNRSMTVLPYCETEEQFFCHENDILSSRSDLDMVISNKLREVLNLTPIKEDDINDYVLPFQFKKHRYEKLVDVAATDPQYIRWMSTLTDLKEPLASYIKDLV